MRIMRAPCSDQSTRRFNADSSLAEANCCVDLTRRIAIDLRETIVRGDCWGQGELGGCGGWPSPQPSQTTGEGAKHSLTPPLSRNREREIRAAFTRQSGVDDLICPQQQTYSASIAPR